MLQLQQQLLQLLSQLLLHELLSETELLLVQQPHELIITHHEQQMYLFRIDEHEFLHLQHMLLYSEELHEHELYSHELYELLDRFLLLTELEHCRHFKTELYEELQQLRQW